MPGKRVTLRVLLRNTETKKYFAGVKAWHTDATKALDFEDGLRALSFVKENKIQNVGIVLEFGKRRYDVRIDGRRPG